MKPATERSTQTFECWTVKEPLEEIEVVVNGKRVKQWRYGFFHFTTHDRPVTVNGVQFVPLSTFDQVRWGQIVDAPE